ncbi:amino acid/amide ABC transporter ATP-binding protein 1, HAAT family (TC 3.A.1.4.-) [Tardiphaga sp. OK246]|uniref:ABC transporter ATP-binding protein n=1 Tax=Tardiphaga sp. OK246 TaxID=1855307 RepID=UPI000B6956A0|nr:ABC transporter ATP-binding protein [Tardiphaga sp. OK246]SNT32731.1 amino acid/amide ABC transporter ATP-binding protein 1, HAAT family (TC 3.A.1.4.-) [Tardiphaga sp. OK246]
MSGLLLKDVSKAFGGVVAADKVSMDVPPGRVTGVIGPNGAGKTTLINLITGMLTLPSGEILLDGENLGKAPAAVVGERGVARTFQNIRLLPDETVIDNVMVGFNRLERSSIVSDLLGLPASRKETHETRNRTMSLLEKFGMGGLAYHPAGSLSYGHQRRVEMMRAIASDPKVILLDEPVAGMNEVESDEMAKVFRGWADRGAAVLIIEHNMRFISSISDYLYVLDRGKIIAEGSPKNVLGNPDVIAAYLGA